MLQWAMTQMKLGMWFSRLARGRAPAEPRPQCIDVCNQQHAPTRLPACHRAGAFDTSGQFCGRSRLSQQSGMAT
jgi:hypothetical protein